MTGARPRLSSSTSSSCGRPITARASTSICCSPPDSSPALRSSTFSSAGNQARICSIGHDVAACAGRPRRRFSAAVRSKNRPRSSGTCATPVRASAHTLAIGDRRLAGLGSTEHRDRSVHPWDQAGDGEQRRRLAGAVRAEQCDHLAPAHHQVDVVDDRRRRRSPPRPPRAAAARRRSRGPTVRGRPVDRGRRRSRWGRGGSRSGVPLAISRPKSSTCTTSHTLRMSDMSWSTSEHGDAVVGRDATASRSARRSRSGRVRRPARPAAAASATTRGPDRAPRCDAGRWTARWASGRRWASRSSSSRIAVGVAGVVRLGPEHVGDRGPDRRRVGGDEEVVADRQVVEQLERLERADEARPSTAGAERRG